ncbi:Uncharacterised protein [uncultured archaeon]|nr:Uncharacterised protein [uncultured archaeon]
MASSSTISEGFLIRRLANIRDVLESTSQYMLGSEKLL